MGTNFREGYISLFDSVVFEPSGGQFGGGEAPEPYRNFFGIGDPTPVGSPFRIGGAVSADLPFIGNVELFRARLFGDLGATFGLDITAAFDPGSIDAVLPYDLAIAFPDLDPVADEGEIIAIHFAGTPDFGATAGFTTSFPSLRFQIDLVAALEILLAAELGVAIIIGSMSRRSMPCGRARRVTGRVPATRRRSGRSARAGTRMRRRCTARRSRSSACAGQC